MRTAGILHVASSSSNCRLVTGVKVPVYDTKGRLKKVYASASAKSTCPSGLADHMITEARIEKNGAVAKSGKTSTCNKKWCTLTYSAVSWLCRARPGDSPRSYIFCDGYYRGEGAYRITLATEVWSEPPPKGCSISHSGSTLTCTLHTKSEYVPETG
jgi:hypothetical protein